MKEKEKRAIRSIRSIVIPAACVLVILAVFVWAIAEDRMQEQARRDAEQARPLAERCDDLAWRADERAAHSARKRAVAKAYEIGCLEWKEIQDAS